MQSDHGFSAGPEQRPRSRQPLHQPPSSARRAEEPADEQEHDSLVLREMFGPFAFGPVATTVRHFPDQQGTRWRVYERRTADEGAPSLYFESTHAVRRVRVYPPGWDMLTDAELERLSWGR